MSRKLKKRTAYGFCLVLILLSASAGFVLFKARGGKNAGSRVPSMEVRLDDFIDYVEMRGEISVRSSNVIAAPYNAGDLQILTLARNGAHLRKGDIVVQFDPTTLQRTAEQARSSLKQADAEMAKAKAQQLLVEEQIKTELLSAQFELERARLDAATSDVIPSIENEKNVLALEKAEHKLKELESRMASRRVGLEADLAAILRRREKAEADLEQAESRMAALTLTSPSDGIITFLQNSRARMNLLGGSTPVFKEGDRAYAGASIAEIPDLSTIQANAPVSEADRGRVKLGQIVLLNIEAVPDKEHKGRVRKISPLAKIDYSSYLIAKNFDLEVELENPDSRLRPGMTAACRVEVERIPDCIVIPAEAVFLRNGRTIAYVLSDGEYRERPLTLGRRRSGKTMVSSGLRPGERIALKDPTLSEKK